MIYRTLQTEDSRNIISCLLDLEQGNQYSDHKTTMYSTDIPSISWNEWKNYDKTWIPYLEFIEKYGRPTEFR